MASVMTQAMEMVAAMYEQMGPDAMPRLLKCSPRTRERLYEDALGRDVGGVFAIPPTQIETDYGTLRVEADPLVPDGTMWLVHDERQMTTT